MNDHTRQPSCRRQVSSARGPMLDRPGSAVDAAEEPLASRVPVGLCCSSCSWPPRPRSGDWYADEGPGQHRRRLHRRPRHHRRAAGRRHRRRARRHRQPAREGRRRAAADRSARLCRGARPGAGQPAGRRGATWRTRASRWIRRASTIRRSSAPRRRNWRRHSAVQFKAAADARRQHGLPKQATTQQDIDNAEAALRSADAQVDQAEAGGAAGRPGAAVHRRGRGAGAPARGAGGAGAGAARPGGAEPVLDQGRRAAGRLDHQAQRRAGQLRAGRPGPALAGHAGYLGHRQFQGIAARPHAARPEGGHQRGCLSAAAAEGPRRQHPAWLRLALHRLPAGERHRQLRQDRAARAGEDRHRQRHGSEPAAAAGPLGRADGPPGERSRR